MVMLDAVREVATVTLELNVVRPETVRLDVAVMLLNVGLENPIMEAVVRSKDEFMTTFDIVAFDPYAFEYVIWLVVVLEKVAFDAVIFEVVMLKNV